tara:strand:- start:4273 stop:5328 length:1056 start_codon:yes stop_codon:yes gene_type:complete
MSYTPSTIVSCPNFQVSLDSIYDLDAAKFYAEPIPFTEYLRSPINRNGMSARIAPGDAKVRTVELTYTPRLLESAVSSNVANTCTASTVRGNTSTDYTIDTSQNLSVEELITLDSLKSGCESNAVYLQEKVMHMMAILDRKVNIKNATQAAALLGGWASNTGSIPFVTLNGTNLEVQTLQPSSAFAPFPSTFQSLRRAGTISNLGQFVVAGGLQLDSYIEQIKDGCCADYGLDVGAIQARYGLASIYDNAIADAAGGDEFSWAIANGALQVIEYNKWQGVFALSDSNESYGTIVSPATGIAYDLFMGHSCGSISMSLTATTKLVALPADMYQTGDRLEGVNGFAQIEVVNV